MEKTCSAAAEKKFNYDKPNQTFGVVNEGIICSAVDAPSLFSPKS